MYYEAFLSGMWASIGSTLGKISGTEAVVGDSYIVSGVVLGMMLLVNTWSCRHYLRSLDASSNSVAPTVISAGSSYVLCGVIGMVLFDESAPVRWWIGAMLIISGLVLVARSRDQKQNKD